jgi:hypothetical protein
MLSDGFHIVLLIPGDSFVQIQNDSRDTGPSGQFHGIEILSYGSSTISGDFFGHSGIAEVISTLFRKQVG